MNLIVIFGPAAVGKMTVGMKVARLTGYKLFHNHMIIEPPLNFYGYDDEQFGKLLGEFRRRMFE